MNIGKPKEIFEVDAAPEPIPEPIEISDDRTEEGEGAEDPIRSEPSPVVEETAKAT